MASSSSVTQTEVSNGVQTRSQKRLSESLSSSNGVNQAEMLNGKSPRPAKAFTTKEAEWKSAVPKDVPSILELKRVLPAHCFSPSLVKSYYYVLKDFVIIAALYVVMLYAESDRVPGFVKYAVTPVYWYLQVRTCMLSFPCLC